MNFFAFLFIIVYIILGIKYPHIFFRRRRRLFDDTFAAQSYDEILRENSDENMTNYAEMQALRSTYEVRLDSWMRNHTVKNQLKNDFCELSLYHTENADEKPDDLCFHCKEHSILKNKPGRFFYVKGNNEHTATMWAIINMEFNKKITYEKIRHLYKSINNSNFVESTQIFYESSKILYPDFIVNKWAQNEYCKMEILSEANDKKILHCYDLWSTEREFYIEGEKLILYGILGNFARNKNKTETFNELLEKFSKIKNCKILKEKKVKPDSLKDENTKQIQEKIIEKFNERHLDL